MVDVVQNCLGQLVVRIVTVLYALLQSVHTGHYNREGAALQKSLYLVPSTATVLPLASLLYPSQGRTSPGGHSLKQAPTITWLLVLVPGGRFVLFDLTGTSEVHNHWDRGVLCHLVWF